VVMAACLHDISKDCPDNQKRWAQHAHIGSMFISADVTDKIQWLVSQHMRAISYSKEIMRPHKRKILEESLWFDELMQLHGCDKDGRNADDVHMGWENIYKWLDENDTRENHVIVLIGIQASGKSTVSNAIVETSRNHNEWWKPKFERTSKDDLRLLMGAGPGAYRHQESCVNNIQRQIIRMALGRGQGIIIDNCNNTVKRRRDILEWLQSEFPGIYVEAHFVYAELETCIARNKNEHGQPGRHRLLIPEKVLRQFHGDMSQGFNNKMGNDAHIEKCLLAEGFNSVSITRTN